MVDTCDPGAIRKLAAGDEAALRTIYDAHAQTLYNFAVRALRSADEAADAVNGIFLSLRTGGPGWHDPAPPIGVMLSGRLRDSLTARLSAGARRPGREVDLWNIVSAGRSDDPAVEAARLAIRRSGVVSAAVLTLVYFGGYTIPEVAGRLSMTESECRSRLQVCLERLAGSGDGARRDRAHGGRFLVDAAVRALGASGQAGETGYATHLAGGCPECEGEIARYAAAAHRLPRLLPDVRLPDEMLDKLMFAMRVAALASPGGSGGPPAARENPAAPDPTEPAGPHTSGAAAGSGSPTARARHGAGPRARRTAGRLAWAAAALAAGAVVILGAYAQWLRSALETQAEIVESLQDRHTELILKYDRLAGISGFFETKGVVTVLNGTPEFPGLAGKIVWDTVGGSAMLQILHPPEELEKGRFRLKAVGDEATLKIAEFEGDGRDSGRVLYRFFPVDVGPRLFEGSFAVDAVTDAGYGSYREILQGAVSDRP